MAGHTAMPGSPLDGTFELDLELDESLVAAAHTSPPRHHRSSSLVETSSTNGSLCTSLNGSLNGAAPAATGSANGSTNGGGGGARLAAQQLGPAGPGQQQPGGFAGISIDMPDFAAMLPSECSFSESVTDEVDAAPTPHTPVVLSIFEGEGIEAASARSHGSSARHGSSGCPDEFDLNLSLLELGPHCSTSGGSCHHCSSTHGVHVDHTLVQLQQSEEGWLPPQFSSLLNRRTLSAVMEAEEEGQEDEQAQQQEQEQQEQEQEQPEPTPDQQALEPQRQEEEEQQQQQELEEVEQLPAAQQLERSASAETAGDLAAGGSSSTGEAVLDACGVELQLDCSPEAQPAPSAAAADAAAGQAAEPAGGSQECLGQQQQQAVVCAGGEEQASSRPIAAATATAASEGEGLGQHRKTDSLEYAAVEIRIGPGAVCGDEAKSLLLSNAQHATAAAAASQGDDAGDAAPLAVSAVAADGDDEWAAANKQRLKELLKQSLAVGANSAQQQQPHLSYPEAEALLLHGAMASGLRSHRAQVLQSLPPDTTWLGRQLQRLAVCWGGPQPGLQLQEGGRQREELVLLLSLAKASLTDAEEGHVALLRAVFASLTGCRPEAVPRFGPHWSRVGFQGDDPATDLRGVGVLGLLQLLFLTHHSPAAACKLQALANSEQQDFPLAIVSLNISRWTLLALRSGGLTRPAKRLGSYVAAANHFYCGAFYEFYSRWCQGRTMREAGFVLKQLEDYCRRHPARLIRLAAAPEEAMAAADKRACAPASLDGQHRVV